MNSFLIDGCEDCQIYILDITAQVTIDYCKNCNIFLSPCESTVFLRNLDNCKIASISSQLRLRECTNMDIMLYSATKPCIENSTNINFYCYQFAYFNLLKQMETTKLSISGNRWSEIQDFGVEEQSVFKIKSNDSKVRKVFAYLFDDITYDIKNELSPINQLIIPLTN